MKRILVFSPHPDDEAIGCGGTLRRHVAAGDDVRVVFLTSGERGCRGVPPEKTMRIRESEARCSTALAGIGSIEFWREPDGRLRASNALVARVAGTLQVWRPHRVYAPHSLESHPDHRAATRLVRLGAARLGPSRRTVEIMGYEVWTPMPRMDEIVDITPFIADKTRAIRAYRSQCRLVGFDEAMRGLARYRGEMHCWPEGRFAEVFVRVAP